MKLVDTSVVVDIDRGGVDDRVAWLDDEGRHAISVVTYTGLRLGSRKDMDPTRPTVMLGYSRLSDCSPGSTPWISIVPSGRLPRTASTSC